MVYRGGMVGRSRIVGLVRFSYPAQSGFRQMPEDPAQAAAALYDPERLERRFRLFESLTVPSLRGQTDAGFQTVVLTGPDLPPWARDRLRAALAGLDGASIVTLPPLPHYTAVQRAFATALDDATTHLASFRLDDDDALDRGHIARLRQMAAGMAGICGPERIFCMGHNRGLYLHLRDGVPVWTDVTERQPLGTGLMMVAPVASRENVFRRNHRLVPQFFTTLTDADSVAWIRTVHAGNDSEAGHTGQSRRLDEAEVALLLRAGFPFLAERRAA